MFVLVEPDHNGICGIITAEDTAIVNINLVETILPHDEGSVILFNGGSRLYVRDSFGKLCDLIGRSRL